MPARPGGRGTGGAVASVNAVSITVRKTALDYALENSRQAAEFAAVLRNELGGKRAADL